MLLQNYGNYAKLALGAGSFKEVARSNELIGSAGPICGTYTVIGSQQVALYRRQGTLYLRVGVTETHFDSVKVERIATACGARLRMTSGGKLLLDEEIVVEDWFVPNDPTMVEQEDFDFSLFLHNLSRSSGRQMRVFAQEAR